MIAFLIQILIALAVVGAFILLLAAAFVAAGNFIPTATIEAAIQAANSYIHLIFNLFPLTTIGLVTILGLFFTAEGFFGVYKLTKWIWQKIPGIN